MQKKTTLSKSKAVNNSKAADSNSKMEQEKLRLKKEMDEKYFNDLIGFCKNFKSIKNYQKPRPAKATTKGLFLLNNYHKLNQDKVMVDKRQQIAGLKKELEFL